MTSFVTPLNPASLLPRGTADMCAFLQESLHTDDDPDPTGLDDDRKPRYCAYLQEMPYDGIRHHHRDVGRPVEIRHVYYGLIGFIARSFQHRTACTTLIGEVLVCDSTSSPLSCIYRLAVADSISMHSVLATVRRYLSHNPERRGTTFFVPRRLRGSDTYEVGKDSSETDSRSFSTSISHHSDAL